MTESLSDILNKSFKTWSSNLLITAFLILESIAIGIAAVGFFFVLLFYFLFSVGINIDRLSAITDVSDVENIVSTVLSMPVFLLIGLFIILIMIFVLLLISSYFRAGLIGMSRNAVILGKTKVRDFTYAGSKFYKEALISQILVSTLVFLILSVIFFLTVGLFLLSVISESMFILVFALFLLLLCLLIPFSFVLNFIVYGTVLEGAGVTDGIKRSVRFITNNFKTLFILGIIYMTLPVISVILNIVTNFSGSDSMISIVIILFASLILLALSVLITFFWEPFMLIASVRLYMDRSEISAPILNEKENLLTDDF